MEPRRVTRADVVPFVADVRIRVGSGLDRGAARGLYVGGSDSSPGWRKAGKVRLAA